MLVLNPVDLPGVLVLNPVDLPGFVRTEFRERSLVRFLLWALGKGPAAIALQIAVIGSHL